jgi:site-specific recombinase XerD
LLNTCALTVTVVDGWTVTVDYGVLSGNKPTAGVLWSNTGSADIISDLITWRTTYGSQLPGSIGLDSFTPHDLRHPTASLAVSAGANVEAMQRLLGYASASMTLDVTVHCLIVTLILLRSAWARLLRTG